MISNMQPVSVNKRSCSVPGNAILKSPFCNFKVCVATVPSITMHCSAAIQCPFCGQSFELAVDSSIPSQRFTTDCEVCCRPLEVSVECEPGEILSLDVQAS